MEKPRTLALLGGLFLPLLLSGCFSDSTGLEYADGGARPPEGVLWDDVLMATRDGAQEPEGTGHLPRQVVPSGNSLGSLANPIVITAFPFHTTDDTDRYLSDSLDNYSCPPSSGSEEGPEIVYAFTVDGPGWLHAWLSDPYGVDIDIHLLPEDPNPQSCLGRAHEDLQMDIEPGAYHLVADTWTNSSGREYPGSYTLDVAFVPQCESDGWCGSLCDDDPDCTEPCAPDGVCDPECNDDPDCTAPCAADGWCDPACNDDPDCTAPCADDGWCDPACNDDPDCTAPCADDGWCDPACNDDPDCTVPCAADGWCDPACNDDPDCAVPCAADGWCDPACNDDPDCATGDPLGSFANPIVIDLPYHTTDDTTRQASDEVDSYSCMPDSGGEGGPEIVYAFTVDAPGTLHAWLSNPSDVDIDLQLLPANQDPHSCLGRAHEDLRVTLSQAGTYHLVADSWSDASGEAFPGSYTLDVTFSTDPVTGGEGTPLGQYYNTYYYLSQEQDYSGEDSTTLYDSNCNPIATVPASFSDSVCIEGSGRLEDGQVINYAKTCSCGRSCPTGGIICYLTLDAEDYPWGMGSRSNPLEPLRSLAVDQDLIPYGTRLYLQELDGVSIPAVDGLGGFVHDGCVRADDTGGWINGRHFDFFAGTAGMWRALERIFPTETYFTLYRDPQRCP